MRGRRFPQKAPAGVRPTSDAVREAIFNILAPKIDFEGAICADLCAGTGAMGFEALSRGAEFVYFVEKSRKTASQIKKTAELFGISVDSYLIVAGDAVKFAEKFDSKNRGKLDLVFIDPPYALNLNGRIIDALAVSEALAKGAIVVSESDSENAESSTLEALASKKYGGTYAHILKR